jgi:hypothetical protein
MIVGCVRGTILAAGNAGTLLRGSAAVDAA